MWGVRDLPFGCLAGANALDIEGLETLTWNNNLFEWNTWDRTWGSRNYDRNKTVLILGGETTGAGAPILKAEETNTFQGVPRHARIEKLGIRLAGENIVTVHEVWPRATGGIFTVHVGSQMAPNGPVSWKSSQQFDPELDRKVTCRVTGRYPCVAFETLTDSGWDLEGYQLKYAVGGAR